MPDRLKGKVAVVTGAAPRGEGVGNGMACAIMFAREGAKVVLVNRDAGRAEALARQIAHEGGQAAVFAGDVTKPAAAEAMANFAVERYGGLDVLHNNVGVGVPGTAETVKFEDWHRVLDANLTSAMLCSKFAIPNGAWAAAARSSWCRRSSARLGCRPIPAGRSPTSGLFGLTYSLRGLRREHPCQLPASSSARCTRLWRRSGPANARERRRQMV